MIVFLLIWLLALDACHTQMSLEPPAPPQPTTYEEVAPEPRHVEQPPQEVAPKNLSEHDHLKLLKGQIEWMQKRVGNEGSR